MKINIKPLTVNQCWRGRRFKTAKYEAYEIIVKSKLQNMEIPKGHLHLDVVFGVSSKLADIDNPLKPFIDILQKKYGFNDRDIFKLTVEKEFVNKGKEFIDFEIKEL
jgi:Holliday junction resolvase RusA-like endonuclease